jgi:hypothetical protein
MADGICAGLVQADVHTHAMNESALKRKECMRASFREQQLFARYAGMQRNLDTLFGAQRTACQRSSALHSTV